MVDLSIVFCMLTRPGNFQWLTHQSSTQSSGFASRISTWCWRICTPPVKSFHPVATLLQIVGFFRCSCHRNECFSSYWTYRTIPISMLKLGMVPSLKETFKQNCPSKIQKWSSSSLGKKKIGHRNSWPWFPWFATSKSSLFFHGFDV
jgi:hypothetical protein